MSLQLDATTWAAARLAAGEDVPDAPEPARTLAATALDAADRQVMDDVVAHLAAGHVPSGRAGPRVSDYGSCRRAVWYRESPPAGFIPDPPQYERQAALGTLIHEGARLARSRRYPWRLHELEVSPPGLDRPGRVDEYDPVLGDVYDLKTAGDRRWDVIGDDGPGESAWGQVLIYAYTLDDAGLPVRRVRIVAVHRESGQEEQFVRDYNPAAGRAALDDLVELATMLDLGVVPPRDGHGPSNDWRCRSCFARSHCWSIPAATDAGRSPESYTRLGAEPEDETVVWAIEQHMAAKDAAAKAKAAADEAKGLLDGIEPGEYGDFVVSETRRRMPEYKDSFERAVQLYGLSEAHRPPVSEVATPLTRVDRYTTVRRKRAAQRAKRKADPQ